MRGCEHTATDADMSIDRPIRPLRMTLAAAVLLMLWRRARQIDYR